MLEPGQQPGKTLVLAPRNPWRQFVLATDVVNLQEAATSPSDTMSRIADNLSALLNSAVEDAAAEHIRLDQLKVRWVTPGTAEGAPAEQIGNFLIVGLGFQEEPAAPAQVPVEVSAILSAQGSPIAKEVTPE